jgi:hypothetical protein
VRLILRHEGVRYDIEARFEKPGIHVSDLQDASERLGRDCRAHVGLVRSVMVRSPASRKRTRDPRMPGAVSRTMEASPWRLTRNVSPVGSDRRSSSGVASMTGSRGNSRLTSRLPAPYITAVNTTKATMRAAPKPFSPADFPASSAAPGKTVKTATRRQSAPSGEPRYGSSPGGRGPGGRSLAGRLRRSQTHKTAGRAGSATGG